MARISTISEQYPIFELYEVAKELKVAFIRGFCPSNHIIKEKSLLSAVKMLACNGIFANIQYESLLSYSYGGEK